jgi:hypothetical protein
MKFSTIIRHNFITVVIKNELSNFAQLCMKYTKAHYYLHHSSHIYKYSAIILNNPSH